MPEEIKRSRHVQLADASRKIAAELNKELEGTYQLVLIEGDSKKSSDYFQGRTDGNTKAIFGKTQNIKPGDYVIVKIKDSTSQTLRGDFVQATTIQSYRNDLLALEKQSETSCEIN